MTTPAYGLFGTKGPAPRFTWGEVQSNDGDPTPTEPGIRDAIVRTARNVNALRILIAREYGVPVAHVYVGVNSWRRSVAWNAKVGGERDSFHSDRRGKWTALRVRRWVRFGGKLYRRRFLTASGCCAIDVTVTLRNRKGRIVRVAPSNVARIAERVPAFAKGGIGRYATFTHLDTRGYRARWNG